MGQVFVQWRAGMHGSGFWPLSMLWLCACACVFKRQWCLSQCARLPGTRFKRTPHPLVSLTCYMLHDSVSSTDEARRQERYYHSLVPLLSSSALPPPVLRCNPPSIPSLPSTLRRSPSPPSTSHRPPSFPRPNPQPLAPAAAFFTASALTDATARAKSPLSMLPPAPASKSHHMPA